MREEPQQDSRALEVSIYGSFPPPKESPRSLVPLAGFQLLIIGWAIAGFLLYALSTFLPIAVMAVILIGGLGDREIRLTKN